MKINVGVFFGGDSVEHEISIISALQVINALNKDKFFVVPIYISKDSIMYTGNKLLDIANFSDTSKLLSKCEKVAISRAKNEVIVYRNPPKIFNNSVLNKIDVAFPVVHGTNCEDGTLQGFFEILRLPYVGSNVISSAIGMDKIITKSVLKSNGIPMVDFVAFNSREWVENQEVLVKRIEDALTYPLIVKPANLGSSVGVAKVESRRKLVDSIDFAQTFSSKVIVETAVVNLKEVNCSVFGDYSKIEISICEEPLSSEEILSYQEKYINKNSTKGMASLKRKIPAEISKDMEREIRELAERTFKAFGCNGVVRIDFLIDINTSQVYVNELNTIPGSLSFYLWEATGKSFDILLEDLINLAFKRERERQRLVFSYSTNILASQGSKA